MIIRVEEEDWIKLRDLVIETLDNVQSSINFDESISNLEEMDSILLRVLYDQQKSEQKT